MMSSNGNGNSVRAGILTIADQSRCTGRECLRATGHARHCMTTSARNPVVLSQVGPTRVVEAQDPRRVGEI